MQCAAWAQTWRKAELTIMKTFIQFNQLSYYTNRELGNVYKKKKNSVFISYEIRKASPTETI